MSLRRRRLLALFSMFVAGCGETREGALGDESATDDDGDDTDRTGGDASLSSTPRESTPAGSPVNPQSISVGNPQADAAFVTVAVERQGATAFVESRELVSSERHTMRTGIDRAGSYRVLVETAGGDRTTYPWDVEAGLDGLAVTLADGIEVRRTVRCGPDCAAFVAGERLDEPLIGDGSPRWYAPAQVVLDNPGPRTDTRLMVSLDGKTLVDARYRVARETQLVVPLTYRSGTYKVAVERTGERIAGEWRVPEEPTRVVDLATLDVGCGPANTQLRLENDDTEPHALAVGVTRDGAEVFRERYRLDPGERREVVPVTQSGRYDVRLRVDDGPERTEPWWSCPPHGPATVRVDATGAVSLSQEGGGV